MSDTKYKEEGVPDDFLKFGVYFQSENDTQTTYFIYSEKGVTEGNAKVKVFTTEILSNWFDVSDIEIGNIIGLASWHLHEEIVEIDLWGKYFFPKFNNKLQLYYCDEKYYGRKWKTNSITSMFEAINYAIEYGLKANGIKPY